MMKTKRVKRALFYHIKKFNRWAKRRYYSVPQDDIGGEWELNYDFSQGGSWNRIYSTFENFLEWTNCREWTKSDMGRLLYIIARDNEIGWLVKLLAKHEDALILLAKQSLIDGPHDAKWQLAVALTGLSDRSCAMELLEKFVEDSAEYVVRRSIMALADLGSDKTEILCEKLWHKSKYGEWEEYQRIAILASLNTIKSDKIRHYIALAKVDGRPYLFAEAERIENEMQVAE